MSELAPALVKPDDVKGAVAVLEKHRSSVVDTVRAKREWMHPAQSRHIRSRRTR